MQWSLPCPINFWRRQPSLYLTSALWAVWGRWEEGCALLLRIMITAEVLCMLTLYDPCSKLWRWGVKEELYMWIRNLAVFYILFTALLHLVPDGKYQRYVRFFYGPFADHHA